MIELDGWFREEDAAAAVIILGVIICGATMQVVNRTSALHSVPYSKQSSLTVRKELGGIGLALDVAERRHENAADGRQGAGRRGRYGAEGFFEVATGRAILSLGLAGPALAHSLRGLVLGRSGVGIRIWEIPNICTRHVS